MGFVLYRSSAGSGKTYTLVKEYLKIVLQNPEAFKKILAVTFTNKAAAEMKNRIVQSLRKLANNEDPDFLERIKEETGFSGDIPKRSAAILTHVLHNYSDFAIMTIDSFIHKVIKSFALEIGLPLNFGIDLNYEKLETYVIEKLLAGVGRDEFITEIILEFVFSRLNEEKSWNIEGDIRRFEKEILKEKNVDWVKGIAALDYLEFHQLLGQLQGIRDNYIATFNKLGNAGLELILKSGLQIQDFAYKTKGPAGFLKKCSLLRRWDLKDFSPGLRFRAGNWTSKSMDGALRGTIEALLENGLDEIHQAILHHFDTNNREALTAVFILDNIYLAAIINRIKLLIEEYKKRHNMIPIAEFNIKVNDIVKNSPVPFIYSVMGEKFNHYLIDEFQDTSTLQFENLLPLIENALGYESFNMAVGDGKQSIYRWRGSDWRIMHTGVQEKIDPSQLETRTLANNFRSCQNIVHFNNLFFESLPGHYGEANSELGHIYGETAQKPVRSSQGYVYLQLLDKQGPGEDPDEAIFQIVNREIADCLKQGYQYSDIAILVRKNEEGHRIAENLLQQNLPVVSPDSLVMARIPIIRFFINILVYLANPAEKISQSVIIYYITLNCKKQGLDPAALGAYFLEEKQTTITPELTEFFSRKHFLARMPIYEVIEEIIRIFKIGETLSYKVSGYLQAFLDITAKYSTENNVDIYSFLDWWELNKNNFNLSVPETKPAIKIMSIHKAKGLEFPVVIIPYANWEHTPDKQLWIKPDPLLPTQPPFDTAMPINASKALVDTYFSQAYQEENEKVLIDNINLLYVAFTRAGDRLQIISREKRSNENHQLLKDLATPILVPHPSHPGVFTFGQVTPKEKKELFKEEIGYREEEHLVSNNWYHKISIRRHSREFWKFDPGYEQEKRSWGILVHQVLARIRTTDQVDAAIDKAYFAGEITIAEEKTMRQMIFTILADPQVAGWFESGLSVLTEAPIITDQGILRPDRVVFSGDQVTIIDFKTGRKNPAHQDQIKKYAQAVKAMGHVNVKALLYYLETGETLALSTGENK